MSAGKDCSLLLLSLLAYQAGWLLLPPLLLLHKSEAKPLSVAGKKTKK